VNEEYRALIGCVFGYRFCERSRFARWTWAYCR